MATITYHFARNFEIDEKNVLGNNVLFHDYVDSVIEKWDSEFRLVDLTVGNVTDQKVNLSMEAEKIYTEYSEIFNCLNKGGVNGVRKTNFLKAISGILTFNRIDEIKMRKEAFKLTYNALEEISHFPVIGSEKSFFVIVMQHAHDEVLSKMMG